MPEFHLHQLWTVDRRLWTIIRNIEAKIIPYWHHCE